MPDDAEPRFVGLAPATVVGYCDADAYVICFVFRAPGRPLTPALLTLPVVDYAYSWRLCLLFALPPFAPC